MFFIWNELVSRASKTCLMATSSYRHTNTHSHIFDLIFVPYLFSFPLSRLFHNLFKWFFYNIFLFSSLHQNRFLGCLFVQFSHPHTLSCFWKLIKNKVLNPCRKYIQHTNTEKKWNVLCRKKGNFLKFVSIFTQERRYRRRIYINTHLPFSKT